MKNLIITCITYLVLTAPVGLLAQDPVSEFPSSAHRIVLPGEVLTFAYDAKRTAYDISRTDTLCETSTRLVTLDSTGETVHLFFDASTDTAYLGHIDSFGTTSLMEAYTVSGQGKIFLGEWSGASSIGPLGQEDDENGACDENEGDPVLKGYDLYSWQQFILEMRYVLQGRTATVQVRARSGGTADERHTIQSEICSASDIQAAYADTAHVKVEFCGWCGDEIDVRAICE